MSQATDEHHLISPTANLVAYWRKFSNIPYAREVAEMAGADEAIKSFFGERATATKPPSWVISYIEARYKCIMQAVHAAGISQVLELASGLALRGLAVTRQHPALVYVETDLPGMDQEKQAIAARILAAEQRPLPPNLHFCAANALDCSELQGVLQHFDPSKPLAVVNEGFCQYLTMAEKEQLACNIRLLLARFGGVWLTPDIEPYELREKRHWDLPLSEHMAQAIFQKTKRHLGEHGFRTSSEMEAFFARLGFSVTPTLMFGPATDLSAISDDPEAVAKLSQQRHHFLLWHLTLSA